MPIKKKKTGHSEKGRSSLARGMREDLLGGLVVYVRLLFHYRFSLCDNN